MFISVTDDLSFEIRRSDDGNLEIVRVDDGVTSLVNIASRIPLRNDVFIAQRPTHDELVDALQGLMEGVHFNIIHSEEVITHGKVPHVKAYAKWVCVWIGPLPL
jgi:hypothetical protein